MNVWLIIMFIMLIALMIAAGRIIEKREERKESKPSDEMYPLF